MNQNHTEMNEAIDADLYRALDALLAGSSYPSPYDYLTTCVFSEALCLFGDISNHIETLPTLTQWFLKCRTHTPAERAMIIAWSVDAYQTLIEFEECEGDMPEVPPG